MKLKKGLPSRDEILVCTVRSVSPHSAFVSLDEYENLEAMLHISEVARGRIKNIKDHIQEGKQIVCMALRINPKKRYVDVSLKRVRESEKKRKFSEWRMSKRFDKLLGFIGKKLSKGTAEEVEEKILEEYDSLGEFMKIIQRKGIETLDSLGINSEWKAELRKEIEHMISRKKIKIKRTLYLKTLNPMGVDEIREVFSKTSEKVPQVEFRYESAPRYKAFLVTNDYKTGEKLMDSFLEEMGNLCKRGNIDFRFET
jgi:translation initiation factor 2 subunit 1